MDKHPSIFFFHGKESGPFGTKYQALSRILDVTSPDFQNMDIWERLTQAELLTRDLENIFVVGSSYGGLLAALLYSNHPERFSGYLLMAPAFHLDAASTIERMPPNSVVIHGTPDDVVPVESSREMCAKFGVTLIEVEDGHSLRGSVELMKAQVLALLGN